MWNIDPSIFRIIISLSSYNVKVTVSLPVSLDGEIETQGNEYLPTATQQDDGVSTDRMWVPGPPTIGLEVRTPKAGPASSFLCGSEMPHSVSDGGRGGTWSFSLGQDRLCSRLVMGLQVEPMSILRACRAVQNVAGAQCLFVQTLLLPCSTPPPVGQKGRKI